VADDTKSRRLDVKPVERRTFLRYSLIGATSAGLGAFALASLDFLWPRPGDELTGEVPLGDANTIADEIMDERAPRRIPEAGISILVWDPSVSAAERNYGDDHRAIINDTTALMAVNTQSCPHLGCAVPWCQTSQWFECPCHGSRYNRWGEWTDGPAPRGLDRYASWIDEGTNQFVVDLGDFITGPARTANPLEQNPERPTCVDV
jgi:cytochrome b6-f complex iron-sulfur subunit